MFGDEVNKWLEIGVIFKDICLLFGDEVVLPNFIYHNRYNSRIFVKEELKLAEIIENWERPVFGDVQKGQRNI